MTVDFHVHSNASDGTFSPSEIAAKAKKGGFTAIALTDHDNCDGVAEFTASPLLPPVPPQVLRGGVGAPLPSPSPLLLPGIELSIDPGKTFDKFHLLGINIDPNNAALKAFLKSVLDGRNRRNERIIANFRRLGFEMAGTIEAYAHGEVLARPHFARWLMERGHVKTIKEAFDKYLLPESPKDTRCYEDRFHPDQEEAIRVIHGAGGLCVMAHPKYWRRYWRDTGPEYADAERELYVLKEKGLDGLEALYQANTVEEDIAFTRIANKLGLLKSAGSDFHGENKPTIPLGMTVTESFIAPVLERLS